MIRRIPPQFFYPGIVIAILAMSVAAQSALFVSATSDGGAQVIPDYYEKASNWDAEQARAAAIRDGRAPADNPAPIDDSSTSAEAAD